jgi:hypothetical protein
VVRLNCLPKGSSQYLSIDGRGKVFVARAGF